MRADKEQAFILRRAGKSYKEIGKDLGIPLGTLAGWFRNETWSHEIRDHLAEKVSLKFAGNIEKIRKANKERWRSWKNQYREAAHREFTVLKKDPLFIAGLMLYWGEGNTSSRSSNLRLTNSDPEMIKIFHLFLKKILAVREEKIRIWLLLYPDLIESVQKNFWSKLLHIPLENFHRSVFIKGRQPKQRRAYGVCTIEVYSSGLREKILTWIDLYKNEFGSQIIA